jgi:hypothetical protein
MPNNSKPLTHVNLAIWGMHRSGTSLLCSLLAECGVHFGEADQLIPRNQENPNGFWENLKVRELNDALLTATGCDWDHITRFDPANIPDEQLGHFAEESRNILGALGEHPISGIKEPRMCVLTSAWAPILSDSVDVFVYRHPAEIAKSLAMRNGMPYDIGLCLCEYYLVHLLNYLTSRNVIAVSHQELLQSPGEALEKLSAHIRVLKGNSPLVVSDSQLAAVVDMDYYRARRDQEQLPAPLERIWNKLQPKMSLPQQLSVSKRSISLLAEYEHRESENAFLAARLLRNKNRNQGNLLDQISQDYETAKAEIDFLHKNMKQKTGSIRGLKTELNDAHNSNKEKRVALQGKDLVIAQQTNKLKKNDLFIAQQSNKLEENDLVIAQQANKLEENDRIIKETRDELGSQLKELNKINRLYEGTLTTSDDIVKMLTALNIHLGIFTGRFFQLCLSVTSALAGILRISSLKNVDQKLMNLTTDIDKITERYEAKRALGKNKRKNYDDTGKDESASHRMM